MPINSISSIAISGLNTAQRALSAAANNVANISTEGYQRQEVVASERAEGGVSSEVRSAERSGGSVVDDLVNSLSARNAFEANLRVLRTENETIGSLLNVTA
jgi:flagellar hook-associated protein FlgK